MQFKVTYWVDGRTETIVYDGTEKTTYKEVLDQLLKNNPNATRVRLITAEAIKK